MGKFVEHRFSGLVGDYCRAAALTLAELCWPTRCVICGHPGKLVCDACALRLPYVDALDACPVCGMPQGKNQCLFCNSFVLADLGRQSLPFSEARSAILYQGYAKKMITAYKDGGEARMAGVLARLLAASLPPAWDLRHCVLTFIPASGEALRRRGFDHAERIVRRLSRLTGIPVVEAFSRPASQDQRELSRAQRHRNMKGALQVRGDFSLSGVSGIKGIIVVDDVLTTGATLFAACDALREGGAPQDVRIYCLTVARVP